VVADVAINNGLADFEIPQQGSSAIEQTGFPDLAGRKDQENRKQSKVSSN
jgi:hypothetical protein